MGLLSAAVATVRWTVLEATLPIWKTRIGWLLRSRPPGPIFEMGLSTGFWNKPFTRLWIVSLAATSLRRVTDVKRTKRAVSPAPAPGLDPSQDAAREARFGSAPAACRQFQDCSSRTSPPPCSSASLTNRINGLNSLSVSRVDLPLGATKTTAVRSPALNGSLG